MSFRCIFCEQVKEDKAMALEHIIPESLGGTLKLENVCRECNTEIGTKVDSRLTDFWLIRGERCFKGIRTKKGKLRDFDFGDFTLVEDPNIKGRYTMGKGSQQITFWGKWEKDGADHLVLDGEVFLKTDLEKLMRRYHRKGARLLKLHITTYKDPNKGEKIARKVKEKLQQLLDKESTNDIKAKNFRPHLQTRVKFDLFGFQGAIAKIALEFAILNLGKEYAFSDDSKLLKRFILEEDRQKRTNIRIRGGIFPSLAKQEQLEAIFARNVEEHILIMLQHTCTIFLFGKLYGIIQVFEDNKENCNKYREIYENGVVTVISAKSKNTKHYDVAEYIAMKHPTPEE